MKKRGQFYLVSAMVLVTIIIGVVVVTNYSKKNANTRIYDLKEEIDIESKNVLDFGLKSGLSQIDMWKKMVNFTQNYINTESGDKDLYFIFGKVDNMTLKGYQKDLHEVKLNGFPITSSSGEFIGSIDPTGSSLVLVIDDNSYNFPLTSGQNFYFMISQKSGGNEYIVQG